MAIEAAAYWVYVGTYQPEGEEALFQLHFSPSSGALRIEAAVRGVGHPSFLALHPSGRYLYAVSEVPGRAGEVVAFAVEGHSGHLTLRGRWPAHGHAPCHLAIDATGRFLLVANYGSPTVVLYRMGGNGLPEGDPLVVRHSGAGPHPRQTEPHPHGVHIAPASRFVYVPDLGIDRIMIYRLDPDAGSLTPASPPAVGTEPGAGPRHLDFHPAGPYAYAVNEIDSTLVAYARAPLTGALRPLQVLSTLPPGYSGPAAAAEVAVHPSGEYLYASNRGPDSIAIYRIAPHTGGLTLISHQGSGGRTPRHFALDPTGRSLLAANQGSDRVVSFRIDPGSGQLQATGDALELPTPVCLSFRPAPR